MENRTGLSLYMALMTILLPLIFFQKFIPMDSGDPSLVFTIVIMAASIVAACLASYGVVLIMEELTRKKFLTKSEFRFVIVFPLWLVFMMIFMFALMYKRFGLKNIESDPADYLYFSVVTWTTLGYGDILPFGASKILAGFEAIAGYFISALTIALYTIAIGLPRLHQVSLNAGSHGAVSVTLDVNQQNEEAGRDG